MKNKWKITGWTISFILLCAASAWIAIPYFIVQEPQPEESILSLAETLRKQAGEFEAIQRYRQMRIKETPHDTEFINALLKREKEVQQTMQQTVAAYREKLRQEMKQFHELETRVQQLSEAEQRLHQEQIDALKQNQADIIFWLKRSVQEAPRCYCVPSDVKIFLGGR